MEMYLALAVIIVIAIYLILNINNTSDDEEIATSRIPKLSKIIYCCSSLDNAICNSGDIVEIDSDNKKEYYIRAYGNFYKLTKSQIKHLEIEYSIKIR